MRNKGFFSNQGDDTVVVIDLATNTVGAKHIAVADGSLTVTIDAGSAGAFFDNPGDGFESGDADTWSFVTP